MKLVFSPMLDQHHSKNRSRRKRQLKGIESVEAAITLPILFFLLCPVLHLTHHWHVEKMLKIATYEACKAGGKVGGDRAAVLETFEEYTTAFGITNARLNVPRSYKFDRMRAGRVFRLRATAPRASNNLPLPLSMNLSGTIYSGVVTYRKEGY